MGSSVVKEKKRQVSLSVGLVCQAAAQIGWAGRLVGWTVGLIGWAVEVVSSAVEVVG